jgi:hypothetical protein
VAAASRDGSRSDPELDAALRIEKPLEKGVALGANIMALSLF